MKVNKIVLIQEPCELEITGATLLSVDEAKNLLTIEDRYCISWWWLRSSDDYQNYAATVTNDGSIYTYGYYVYKDRGGIRPALQIENLESSNLKIGDKFYFGNECFKIISDHLALCDSIVDYMYFDESSNDYERSEIKAYIDDWFSKLMNYEIYMVEEEVT